MKIFYKYIIVIALFIGITACEKPLEEEIFSSLSPSSLFTTEAGLNSLLNSAYGYAQQSGAVASWAPMWIAGMTTGELWGVGGTIEALWTALSNFTWDANHSHPQTMWQNYFNAIRDANIVLDNIQNDKFSANFKTLATAEAKFIRGWSYGELYSLFGPLPIYNSSKDDPLQPRATEEATRALIEKELTEAIANLPLTAVVGKATKGAAMGVLCKHYLNTKQWQKAADLSKQIMDLNKYKLMTNYADVFAIANEGNDELLWVMAKDAASATASQSLNALIFPTDYPRPFTNNGVFAARAYVFDNFYRSFDSVDTRRAMFITQYVSTATKATIVGLGKNQTFPLKYEWDPKSVGAQYGTDIPAVRYADILLSRAEALNELSGPTQAAIDLINQVRTRAKIAPITLASFATKEALRARILVERGKEFWLEGKRREDMIRQGVFISDALARGKAAAKPHHVLFPIPQSDLDANANLKQNTGY